MNIDPIRTEVYIPTHRGNRADFVAGREPNPVRVHILPPSYDDIRDLQRVLNKYPKLVEEVTKLAMIVGALGQEQALDEVRKLLRLADEIAHPNPIDDAIDGPYFAKHILTIENLNLAGEPIPTGAALWAAKAKLAQRDYALYVELWAALRSAESLDRGLADRLSQPSGSPVAP
jgi:hypothetical protein